MLKNPKSSIIICEENSTDSFFPIGDHDDDIHVIATMKGFILPRFYCMKTHHRPNRMQIIMPTTIDRRNQRNWTLATA
jgi:hypothetical protein